MHIPMTVRIRKDNIEVNLRQISYGNIDQI